MIDKKFMMISLAIFISATTSFGQNKIAVKGADFTHDSRQTFRQNSFGLLKGVFSYGAAIYDIRLPAGTDRVSFEIKFANPKKKWLKLYIYNYGVAYDDPAIRNKKLGPNWRLWEATNGTGEWRSQSPKYLYTASNDSRVDFLGSQNILKVMIFADGGIPLISDGRFVIEQIKVEFTTVDMVIPDIKTSKDVWIEGNVLLVRGRGLSRARIDQPGFESIPRGAALRLAKIDAYRKLAIALGKISPSGGTASIPGSQVKSTRYISDTEVEIILGIPLASLHDMP